MSFPDAGSDAHTVVVEVGLRRKHLTCPLCGFTTRARYDTRPVSPGVAASGLRALGGAATRWAAPGVLPDPRGAGGGGALRPAPLGVHPRLARTWWPTWRPRPTRPRSPGSPAGLGQRRADLRPGGRDGLDPTRLDGLVSIGVDEVSWRRHHRYLTLVADHTGKKIVWGAEGKDTAHPGRILRRARPPSAALRSRR